jgi:XTP/dITP diphosphohydrolase
MKIVFATNNEHKLKEIRHAINNRFQILSLKDMNIFEEIPETADTIEGNAIQKTLFICNKYQMPCFADDTGLEVIALNNRPGIYSSRYAGPECNSVNNIKKVLSEMSHVTSRHARFRTVIAFSDGTITKTFEGIVEGSIAHGPSGSKGFGYDPIFIPYGYTRTFAELTLEQKNSISHRTKALNKFVDFLMTLNK